MHAVVASSEESSDTVKTFLPQLSSKLHHESAHDTSFRNGPLLKDWWYLAACGFSESL